MRGLRFILLLGGIVSLFISPGCSQEPCGGSTSLQPCEGSCVNLQTNSKHCGQCGNICEQGQICEGGTCKVVCRQNQTVCSDVCVDTQTDRAHCGECDKACTHGEVCDGGECKLSCQKGLLACDNTCVDVQTNAQHCGTCNNACTTEQVCREGLCKVLCPQGFEDCDGTCVNTQTSREHCGACDQPCDDGNVCISGTCRLSCQKGLTACSGLCVNLTRDRENCGSCGTQCSDGQICSTGRCTLSCAKGLNECSGLCVNTQNNASHCGVCNTTCGTGQVCLSGQCACPTSTKSCGGNCVDVQTSRAHCGECDKACESGQVCNQGTCKLTCSKTLTECKGGCVDTQIDPRHCGICNNTCSPGFQCKQGKCEHSCLSGLVVCNGRCTNRQSDSQHCGQCGKACNPGETCQAGTCKPFCSSTQQVCNNRCVDIQTDRQHCGACGKACSAGEICISGTCSITCGKGLASCNGSCTNLQNNPAHCGACGKSCPSSQVCVSGVCLPVCPIEQTNCGGTCHSLSSSLSHCGACGKACASGDLCRAGVCQKTWAISTGAGSFDGGEGVIVDQAGNLVVTGYVASSFQLGGTTYPTNDYTTFVAGISPQGSVLWVKTFLGNANFSDAITSDRNNNIYVVGQFYGSITIGTVTLSSSGKNDIYVVKLNNQGVIQWGFAVGGSDTDYPRNVTVDSLGNVYVVGSINSDTTFNNVLFKSKGGSDAFAFKLNALGKPVWGWYGGGPNADFGNAIAVDGARNVYVGGATSQGASFGSGTLTNQGNADAFIAKLSPSGTFQKTISFGSTRYDEIVDLKWDKSSLYVLGTFRGNFLFGSSSFQTNVTDTFVAQTDSALTPTWSTQYGTYSLPSRIEVSNQNNLYIAGALLQPGSVSQGTTFYDPKAVFVAELDPKNGKVLKRYSSQSTKRALVHDMALDAFNNPYITGEFQGALNFGKQTLTATPASSSSSNAGDFFLVPVYWP